MDDSTGAIRRHGEKLFLAAGVAFLLGGAAATALSIGADDEIRRSRGVSDRLNKGLATAPPPAQSPGNRSPIRQDPRSPVPTAGPWQMLRWPQIVPIPIDDGSKPNIKPEVRPLRMEPARDDIGAVTLAWTDDPETNVNIAGYVVERRDPDGRWTVVKETAAGERTYRDATVAPRRTYAWRVTPRIADARCPDLKQGPVSDPVGSTTQEDVRVRYKTMNIAEIRKFQYGAWQTKDFYLKPGEPLGDVANVNVDGIYRKIDFRAGQLIRFADIQKTVLIPREEIIRNASGQPIDKKTVLESRSIKTSVMTFDDREGRRVELEKGQEY